MTDHNSLGAYALLFEALHSDVATASNLPNKEAQREIGKIRKRVGSETLAFFCKFLRTYRKSFDSALVRGQWHPFHGSKMIPGTVLPKLFGWLLCRVFNSDGSLLPEPSIEAVIHVRQLTSLFEKLELPYTDDQIKKVLDSFVGVDSQIRQYNHVSRPSALDWRTAGSRDPVIRKARTLITKLLGTFNGHDILPKHGPGAVATGEKPAEKHVFRRIYSSLDAQYPFTEYFASGLNQVVDEYDRYSSLQYWDYPLSKVVLVPKDSRGPRLISCEPLEVMWIQQGLGRKLQSFVESARLTAGHVNFSNQEVNRNLALSSSLDGKWVTLDMEEASDRVSLSLVDRLFSGTPLAACLAASRSVGTRLPDGRVVIYGKFAPMGSALCFPIESLCFWSLAVASIYVHSLPMVKVGRLRKALDAVYVYGDDLVIDSKYYESVMRCLPDYALRFNQSKCCTSGLFRESCGMDAFQGVCVTPIRVKTLMSVTQTASELASYTAYSTALWQRGYFRASRFISDYLRRKYRDLPSQWFGKTVERSYHSLSNPGLRENPLFSSNRVRFNPHLQRWELWARASTPRTVKVPREGWAALTRTLSEGSPRQPGVYAIPHGVSLRWGWRALT